MYSHMPGNPYPKVKKIPWVRTEASDERTVEPDITLDGEANADEVTEEQMKALGYL